MAIVDFRLYDLTSDIGRRDEFEAIKDTALVGSPMALTTLLDLDV